VELSRSQFDDLQRRLDGENDFDCRATRRTDFAWRTFSASDEAQPQATWCQCGGDSCSEPLPFVWFIKHMKATTVENEPERNAGRSSSEKIQCFKAARQRASVHPGPRSLDRQRRDVDPEYVETAFRHPNCICASTRADLKRRTWLDPARSDELDKQRLWLPGIPWQLSRGVTLIP
jgi:hypothetical protein